MLSPLCTVLSVSRNSPNRGAALGEWNERLCQAIESKNTERYSGRSVLRMQRWIRDTVEKTEPKVVTSAVDRIKFPERAATIRRKSEAGENEKNQTYIRTN